MWRDSERGTEGATGVGGGVAIAEPAAWWAGLEEDWRGRQDGGDGGGDEKKRKRAKGEGQGEADWQATQQGKRFRGFPLKFPVAKTAQGTDICRYHNYSQCKKGEQCEHDHEHCHVCRERGHTAQECSKPSHFGGEGASGKVVDTLAR